MAKSRDSRHLKQLILFFRENGVVEYSTSGDDIAIKLSPIANDAPAAVSTQPETITVARRKLELRDPETVDAVIKARLTGSH